jgi:cytidylate kinase
MAIITICRGTYTGGKEFAEHLSKDLGYRLQSREDLLRDTSSCFGASEEQLGSALAQKPGFLEGRGLKKRQYLQCVQAQMARVAQGNDVVYHGQAGHLLLPGIPHHLRIRVVADMEYRIRVTMEAGMPSRAKAIENIEELDRKRASWMKWIHGVNINDPTAYDMMINLERLSYPVASAMVVKALELDFQTTPESQQIVDDLVLASDVRARLGLNRDISDDRLQIAAHRGVISIRANVRSHADVERAKEFVQQIPGVEKVESELGTRW